MNPAIHFSAIANRSSIESDIPSPVVPQINAPLTLFSTSSFAWFSIIARFGLPSAFIAVKGAAINPVSFDFMVSFCKSWLLRGTAFL